MGMASLTYRKPVYKHIGRGGIALNTDWLDSMPKCPGSAMAVTNTVQAASLHGGIYEFSSATRRVQSACGSPNATKDGFSREAELL